jgi:hypothetical protein
MLVAKPVLFLAVLFGGLATVAAGALLAAYVLAASGQPGDPPGVCRGRVLDTGPPLREVVADPSLAEHWQARWEEFREALEAGEITFEESEATSRAAAFLRETGAPLSDVTICFYEGEAEARAKANLPLLSNLPLIGGIFDTNVRVRGRIDLTGQHPRISVAQLEAGQLPGFIAGAVQDDAERLVNERLKRLELAQDYGVAFHEGQVQITKQ